jgi:hypothetical protein
VHLLVQVGFLSVDVAVEVDDPKVALQVFGYPAGGRELVTRAKSPRNKPGAETA